MYLRVKPESTSCKMGNTVITLNIQTEGMDKLERFCSHLAKVDNMFWTESYSPGILYLLKMGAALKGKNLLTERANSFLLEQLLMRNEANISMSELFSLYPFPLTPHST